MNALANFLEIDIHQNTYDISMKKPTLVNLAAVFRLVWLTKTFTHGLHCFMYTWGYFSQSSVLH